MRPSPCRGLFLLAFLLSAPVLAGSLYLQHGVGLQPCPLASLQRLCLAGFALTCLAAALHGPRPGGARLYALLALLLAGAGGLAAGRQIGLQTLPGGQPGAVPGAPCAEVSWSLLGLSVAEWSLLAFVGLMLVSLSALLRRA